MNLWRLVPAAILACAVNAVQADTITILNPSFEAQVFSTGTGTTYPYGGITDWTATTTSPLASMGTWAKAVLSVSTTPQPSHIPAAFPAAFPTALT